MIKRKNKQGILLKPGESQRKNGSYEFRYTVKSRRMSVYAKTLDELREREAEIDAKLARGIDVSRTDMTVSELLAYYLKTKSNLKENTLTNYQSRLNVIRKDPLGSRRIDSVVTSQAKRWCLELHNKGLKRKSIGVFHHLLRAAFEVAIEDELLIKNPFKFSLASILPNDDGKRQALTPEEMERYLHFARLYASDSCLNEITVLLETGLRVSELFGLTMADIDWERHRLHVSKQLCRTSGNSFKISAPKSKSGIRTIPLTPTACSAFHQILENRPTPKVEMMVDGYGGFIFLTGKGTPKRAYLLHEQMNCLEKIVAEKEGIQLPHVTPHVLRHTYCTNLQQKGLDVKTLQYLMGHSTVQITLDTYSHANADSACEKFEAVFAS